jgi:cytochrome c oxidase subunit I+III
MILLAFPPLIAGDLLLELERALNWPFFDASRGGDPLLWQHLFWIFGHPEVYIIFLPSIALVAMIIPTFARRPMAGYTFIVLAAVGTGFLAFGLWVHHMFTTGLPGISLGLFSAASTAVAIPTSVQIFCFIATMLGSRLVRSVPMLYIGGALATFVIGGLTGVMVAVVPFDFQAHDTHFVVAHLHSVLIGGGVFPILAGVFYYFPVAAGKALTPRTWRTAFVLLFVGFNLTFMPMHFTGLRGMVRRVYTYPEGLGLDGLNLVSTAGAVLLFAGFALLTFDVVRVLRRTAVSPRNPYEAGSLEWLAEMPGESWGVRSIPEVDGRYPLWDQPDLMRDVDEGRFYLPDAEEGKRETLLTSIIDARPEQCLRVPGSSFVPFWAAVFTGGAFIFPTFSWYWAALGSAGLAFVTVIYWLWTGTSVIPEKPEKDVGLGLTLPLYAPGTRSVGWWAMCVTMLGDMVAFLSLAFGYLFYATSRPDFLGGAVGPGVFWPLVAAAATAGAWVCTRAGAAANRRDAPALFYPSMFVAVALAVGAAGALVMAPVEARMNPEDHAYPATVWVLVGWTVLHIALGVVVQLYAIARRAARRLDAHHDIDMANTTLYWHFAAATMGITVALIAGFPLLS